MGAAGSDGRDTRHGDEGHRGRRRRSFKHEGAEEKERPICFIESLLKCSLENQVSWDS